MRRITFVVHGRPVPAVRMTQRSKYKDPAAQRYLAYKEQVGWVAKAAMGGRPPISTGVGIKAVFYLYGRQPDTSNLIKAIEDGCNNIVFTDDSQIIEIHAYRVVCGKDEQRAEVEVRW